MSKSTDDLSSTCPLCYQDITIYAIGKCDHTICHVCSTRMRALCNQLYCPVCRADLSQVVFMMKQHLFSGIITHRFPRDRDTKIWFENNRIRLEYNKLLAHQCGTCHGRMAEGNFKMLQDHMRKEHELFYCDLCVAHLKIFTSERKCYSRKDLAQHRRKGDKEDTSYKGHPLCEFCDKRYFDKDELLKHLRRDHYFCHFCDSTGISNQYYNDYDNLREHFRQSHFLCEQGQCEFEQFSHAFSSDIDLKAHKAAVHGSSFSKFQARQNRQIDVEINLPPRSRDRRGGGPGVGRGRAHLLHSEDDDIQLAIQASMHGARADEEKQSQPKEQNRRRKNRKLPEEDYSDIRDHRRNYDREQRPSRSVVEKREPRKEESKPSPDDFPNLLDRETENRSPLMSASWTKSQTQEPDFPDLNPSAAASSQPQRYPNTGKWNAKNKNSSSDSDYPVLRGRTGPDTNRQSAPKASDQKTQSTKVPSRRERFNESRPDAKVSEVQAPKVPVPSSVPQKVQSAKGPKTQKIDSLSEYPVLGSIAEPEGSPQSSFKDPPSRPGAPRETYQPSTEEQHPSVLQSHQWASYKTPGRVDSLSEYPSLGGSEAHLPNHHGVTTRGMQSNHVPSQKEQPNGTKRRKESYEVIASRTPVSTNIPSYPAPAPDHTFQTKPGDFPSLSSIATLLNNVEKKGPSEKRETPKQTERRKTEPKPQKNEVRPQKYEANPAPSKKEPDGLSSNPAPMGPALSQIEERPVSKPPPGFLSHPPGFTHGPPPGFGTIPVCDYGYVAPPPSENNFVQPEDYKDRNKELVRKIKKSLKDKPGGFDQFRTLSGQYRTGVMSGYDYYDRCLSLLGDSFRNIFEELVSLLPDVDKQQELLRVQRERESSNHVDMETSAVLKISKNSSAAPWRDGNQKKHKVCPQCQQMVLSKDYDSHLNNHQDFPALGSSVPIKTKPGRNSAWGRMK